MHSGAAAGCTDTATEQVGARGNLGVGNLGCWEWAKKAMYKESSSLWARLEARCYPLPNLVAPIQFPSLFIEDFQGSWCYGEDFPTSKWEYHNQVYCSLWCSTSSCFPQKPSSPEVQVSLREVHQAAKRLQDQCHDSGRSTDLAFRTRHIINSAYDVAKAARQLIISVEQEKKGEHWDTHYHSSLEGGLGTRLFPWYF